MMRSLIHTSPFALLLLAGSAFAGDAGDKFRSMDTDGDGRVTATEHANAAQAMFTEADTNRDGSLSMQEVEAHWKKWSDDTKSHDKQMHDDRHEMNGEQMRHQDAADTDTMDDGGN